MKRTYLLVAAGLAALAVLAACQPTSPPQAEAPLHLTIQADGNTQTVTASTDETVSDVLRQAGITLNDLDRVNPPTYSRATDGLKITIVRVTQDTVVTHEPIPFDRKTTLNDSLPPGKEQLLQAGVNGVAEITFRVTYEDGVEVSRSEVRRITITAPQSEVVMVGSQGQLPAVPINGVLAFISNGNAWIIRRNSANRRALTLDGGVDGRVFQLSRDGKRLLFTRTLAAAPAAPTATPGSALATPTPAPTPTAAGGPFNALWMVLDTGDPESKAVRLNLNNVLFADFMPDGSTLVYSTGEPRPNFPGWQANNDLWSATIGSKGTLSNFKLLLAPSSGGVYGWYGTVFAISPSGKSIAWAQADAIGVLKPFDANAGKNTPQPKRPGGVYDRSTLLKLTPRNAYDFVWVPSLSWSPDDALIASVSHQPPVGSEAPEDSPAFALTVLPARGGYSVDLVDRAGMWCEPVFSPGVAPDGSPLPIQLAFLQALTPLDSARSRYQLVIADRDGSNSKALFPTSSDQPGLKPQMVEWSPDGAQIALINQDNLYVLDIATGLMQQITQDGSASNPVWTP